MNLDKLIEELGLKSGHWCGASIPTDWEAIVVPLIKVLAYYPIAINQVKEKFGGLRVYYHWAGASDDKEKIDLLISLAENQCYYAYKMRKKE